MESTTSEAPAGPSAAGGAAPDGPPAERPASRRPRGLAALLADLPVAALWGSLVLTFAVCLDVLDDPDVWWHIRLGRWILDNHAVPKGELFSYTAQGAPMTAHEWLSDTVFAALYGAGGLLPVALLMALVAWSGFLAIALLLRRRGVPPLVIAIAILLGAKASEPVLGTRPQVATFALSCWVLLIADRQLRAEHRRLVWVLPPLFLLWANLHAGFVSGLGILVAILVVEAAKRLLHLPAAPAVRIRALAIATGVAAVAACLNPAGPLLYRFALLTPASESQKPIQEWQSPNFHQAGMLAFLVLCLSLLVLVALSRPDLRDAVVAAAGIGLALISVRNLAIASALALPAWAPALQGAWAQMRPGRRPRRLQVTTAAVVLGVVVVAAGCLGAGVAVRRAVADASPAGVAAGYPECAAAILASAPGQERLVTAYGVAGFLIERDTPHVLVYEYGESISLGPRVFSDFVRITSGALDSPTALQLLDESGTNAVLLPPGALTEQLGAAQGWTHVADDEGMQLWLRGDATWAAGRSC